MRKNNFYVLMAVALMAGACSNETPSETSGDTSESQVITIIADVSPLARTPQLNENGSGRFAKGDVLSLFIGGNGQSLITADYAYEVNELTWDKLGLAADVKQVTFASCYPKQTLGTEGLFEFNALEAVDKDLLLASAQSVSVGTANPVSLTFKHALHRLNLIFTPGNGYSESDLRELSVVLHAKTTCVVDAVKGSIKNTKDVMGNYTSTGNNVSFYLVPQATEGITLNVCIGDNNKEWSFDELLNQLNTPQEEFAGGACSTLTLKVGRDGITVVDGSIGAWKDQVTVDGEIVIG